MFAEAVAVAVAGMLMAGPNSSGVVSGEIVQVA